MGICVLDGREIADREMLHDRLADSLGFPQWYGRNLDALYDCLTDIGEETEIRFFDIEKLEERLGKGYVQALRRVLRDAAEENGDIRLGYQEQDK